MKRMMLTGTLMICAVVAATAAPAPSNNLDCLTCHADMAGETLVMQHIIAEEVVTCTKCHGASAAHIADGTGAAKPDRLHGRTEVETMCGECHGSHEDAQAKADQTRQEPGESPLVLRVEVQFRFVDDEQIARGGSAGQIESQIEQRPD